MALLPLQRRWDMGVRVLSWFPGPHVGCNAPLVDTARLSAHQSGAPPPLWRDMLRSVPGADIVHLRSIPEMPVNGVDLFAELGLSIAGETLLPRRLLQLGRRRHDAAQQIASQA